VTEHLHEQRLRRLLEAVAAIADRVLKVHKLALELGRTRPGAAVELMVAAMEGANQRNHRCQELCLLFTSGMRTVRGIAGEEWWGEFLRSARERGDEGLRNLLDDAQRRGEWLFDLLDEELPKGLEMSLGHKKAAAKASNPFLLDRLLFESDHGIVANLLNNPRLTERDVVRMAARRPVDPDVLAMIAGHARWNRLYRVKKALAFNPWTPTRIAVALVPHLLMNDLQLLWAGSGRGEVRSAVERVVEQKFQGLREGERRDFLAIAGAGLTEILLVRVRRSLEEPQ
jgi:hypothetical protein